MKEAELIKNYLFWCMGQRDAFSEYRYFSRTLKFENINLDAMKFTLELVEFVDQDFKVYAVLNDYVTLYATKKKELALQTYHEFVENFKTNKKEAI